MSATRGRERVRAWVPVLAYMVVIVALSSVRIDAPSIARLPFKDKLVHFVEYAGLGLLTMRASSRTWPGHPPLRLAAFAVLLTSAFGLSDELHQAFVPGRTADARDLLADVLGAMLGVALWLAPSALRRRSLRTRRS